MDIRPVGVTGALCLLGSEISEETGARVARLDLAVKRARLPGVVETVPGFASLLVRYDPERTGFLRLSRKLRRLERAAGAGPMTPGRTVEIPVCYGGEFGPDLADVAGHAKMSEAEVIRLHSAGTYRIYMIGFLPGFPYLGGLDGRLHTPRLSAPRASIPAGSVGIGGSQTGIYPLESPGGWRLIGCTPIRLFAPGRPLPYAAGDSIRFVPVSAEEYRRLEASEWDLKSSCRES